MSASIDTSGLAALSGGLRRAVSGDLQKVLVKNIQDAQRPILTDMQRAAFTRIQAHAADSVVTRRTKDGAEFAGGAGGGLDAILFDGGEYGGRKSKKVTYATRSPRGTVYVVRRRTTMQFLPFLGRRGYIYWPTLREWLDTLTKQQEELIENALGGR